MEISTTIDPRTRPLGDASAQRFTPRRAKSHWTELNKERARRLVAAGLMTEAGTRTLPDLADLAVRVAPDVRARLDAEPGAWQAFERFPPLYQRVRLGYVEEVRRREPAEFERRLANLVARSAKGEMFGNWDDSGLPRTDVPEVPAGATPAHARSTRGLIRVDALIVGLVITLFLACAERGRAPGPPSPATTWSVGAPRVDVRIDRVDDRLLRAQGALDVYLDVTGADGAPLPPSRPEDVAVTIDGVYVPATIETSTFGARDEALAVAFLIGAHAPWLELREAGSGRSLTRDAVAGVGEALAVMSDHDHVHVHFYTRGEPYVVWAEHTPRPMRAKMEDTLGRILSAGSEPGRPRLYDTLLDVIADLDDPEDAKPARRVVMVVSDGADRVEGRARDGRLVEVRARAAAAGVRVYALGAERAAAAPLDELAAVARATGGGYEVVPLDAEGTIGQRLLALLARLDRQWVVRVRAEHLRRGPPLAEVGVALRSVDGRFGEAELEISTSP